MKIKGIFFSIIFLGSLVAGYYFYPKKPPNVLIILVDTLRSDHLSYNGYARQTSPNLDKFAEENLIYRNAVATSSWTPPTVASIFTGLYSSVHGHMPLKAEDVFKESKEYNKLSKLDNSFVTIAEEFKAAGYYTVAVVANPIISERYGFSQGFDNFYGPSAREAAEKVNKRAFKVIDNIAQEKRPFFFYLHYMDPHVPYDPPGEFDTMFDGAIKPNSLSPYESKLVGEYDGEVRYIDQNLGVLFQYLKEKGLYKDLVILFVADHGEQFKERGFFGHADKSNAEEVHVPLILKAKNLSGEEKTIVSQADILPTLLDVAGIKLKHNINGISLYSDLEKRKDTPVMTEIIRHINEKAFYHPDGLKLINEYPLEQHLVMGDGPDKFKNQELYNVFSDPKETLPIIDAQKMTELNEEFRFFYSELIELRKNYTIGSIPADRKSLDQLKTLGYL